MAQMNEVAAQIMEHLCNCSNHGYTQGDGRWGNGTQESIVVDGQTYYFAGGDRDCSSAVISAYKAAGLDVNATYTGNMKNAFLATGMFEWKPMSFIAQRGDIYLNERDHTEICISPSPDLIGGFCINEFGRIVGGQVGDQTGGESRIRGYYDYPWDGILHFTGGQATGTSPSVNTNTQASYTVCMQACDAYGNVLPQVTNDNDNAGDGVAVTYLSAWTTPGVLDVQCATSATGGAYLPMLQNPSNIYDKEYGAVGDGSIMTKLKMYYWSPNSDKAIFYRVMVNGQWLAWMKDDYDTGGSGDNFAGNGYSAIQRVEAYIGNA